MNDVTKIHSGPPPRRTFETTVRVVVHHEDGKQHVSYEQVNKGGNESVLAATTGFSRWVGGWEQNRPRGGGLFQDPAVRDGLRVFAKGILQVLAETSGPRGVEYVQAGVVDAEVPRTEEPRGPNGDKPQTPPP